jgi:hypothetical protein
MRIEMFLDRCTDEVSGVAVIIDYSNRRGERRTRATWANYKCQDLCESHGQETDEWLFDAFSTASDPSEWWDSSFCYIEFPDEKIARCILCEASEFGCIQAAIPFNEEGQETILDLERHLPSMEPFFVDTFLPELRESSQEAVRILRRNIYKHLLAGMKICGTSDFSHERKE